MSATYSFTGNAAKAARHLIENTSLSGLVAHDETGWPLRLSENEGELTIDVSDEWRFSSGEQTVLVALASLTGGPVPVELLNPGSIDEETAKALVYAHALVNS